MCLLLVRSEEEGQLGSHLAVECRPVVRRRAPRVDQVAIRQGRDVVVQTVAEEPCLRNGEETRLKKGLK